MFSCSESEQKQLNTWVSFQSAGQPLLGQFSVSGNRHTGNRGALTGRIKVEVAGTKNRLCLHSNQGATSQDELISRLLVSRI
ncbi:hypothetical protein EIY72_26425 [Pseudomonas vancouverensis]|uniref:Uncharacterized protein n=1 Tax=Pseudomonas vancouverensis TaxID=95300 RepID=A0A4R4JTE2_PSEVA|nr:hypothetical protein F7R09_07255 [Pseudomonas vancouverensis]TDB57793.1 hypothetical protein EIY72_26425 [Pseudomonas vancouverensis]